MSARPPAPLHRGPAVSESLRVGIIAPPWVEVPPPAYGGTEAVIDVLARGLASAGHDVRLFTVGASSCPVPRSSVFAEAQRPMNTTSAELHHVQSAYEALADCDVIHDHTIAGPVWARTLGTAPPVVATCHSELDACNRGIYASVAGTASVIAISYAQRRSARDVAFAGVVHHGLDPAAHPVGTGEGGHLLFVGRMDPRKGVAEAIQIALLARMPIRIVAKMRDPQERAYFEARVRPLLGPGVELLGEVPPAVRNTLMGDAVALLNPIAWDEPFGLVMAESLAAGTPVIAFPRGAAPEIVRDGVTGFLPRSLAAAVDAVGRVRAIDRDACRQEVLSRFTAERMVAGYLDRYDAVLADRPAA